MARPAGLSSDEDDYDSFDDEDFRPVPLLRQRQIDPIEQLEQRTNDIFYAIMRNDVHTFLTLLDEGLEVNISLKDNWNPIMLAASIGAVEIVQELINRGANVNFDREKYTTLMAACSCPSSTVPYEKSAEVAKLLVENGANVNAISRKRMTPLMYAASSGNTDIVSYLLPLSNKDAEDNQGWTALFWAVNDNHPEVVKVLLEAGLNPEKIDIRNNTPIFYSHLNDSKEIQDLLPSKNKTVVNKFKDHSYDFEKEFENLQDNERPQFFRDVSIMLCGMRCEELINIFEEKGVDLLQFVSLNDQKLQEIGVLLPFQRSKVLMGLYKFHKHPYRAKSLPIVGKNEIYSTIDLSNTLISAVRQISTMEGALVFLESHMLEPIWDLELNRSLCQIRNCIQSTKKIVNVLSQKAIKWDNMTKPADLITKNSLKKKRSFTGWLTFFGVITLTFIVVKKNW